MALPTDSRGAASGGADYFKPQTGNNKILIVGEAVTGYEYWTENNEVRRSPEVFEETPGIRKVKKKVKRNGEEVEEMVDDKQKFFWALPIYDYADQQYKVFQVTQKGIRDALVNLQANEDWGDPIGNYTISITKEGEKLQTKYSVTPNPVKDKKEIEKIFGEYQPQQIDLDALFFGGTEAGDEKPL